MPFYRFIIHGEGILTDDGSIGFYTTKWAFAGSQDGAATIAMESVRKDWTSGVYANWSRIPPRLSIDDGWEIASTETGDAMDRGHTFYSATDDTQ
jgi:hypothetical protein